MNFADYQSAALKTAIYPHANSGTVVALSYTALGLAGEAGEVAGKIKKYIRDGTLDKDRVSAELGDVLWYIATLAQELGVGMETIAANNIAKLQSRQERGVLQGSGDNR